MKIWAHTLVKNEEKWLWYSVCSIVDFVDKILLWDTGSSDKTKEIIKLLQLTFPTKIDFREVGYVDINSFADVRQQMLDATDADWFIVLDGDEIWYRDSITNVIEFISQSKNSKYIESIVVPTINVVGDIFHYQEKSAGKYKFGDKIGHYNLRAIKRNIPGLHSQGVHGVWGWADSVGKQIQDRNTYKIINSPYIHTSFLQRGGVGEDDLLVPKREKKLKYEIGIPFPLDFYYPEVFFVNKPDLIPSPWFVMDGKYKKRAIIETPLRKIKRRFIKSPVGY